MGGASRSREGEDGLRYLNSGESHGPCLTAIIEGLPAGLELKTADINSDLTRRQQGYGRGGEDGYRTGSGGDSFGPAF